MYSHLRLSSWFSFYVFSASHSHCVHMLHIVIVRLANMLNYFYLKSRAIKANAKTISMDGWNNCRERCRGQNKPILIPKSKPKPKPKPWAHLTFSGLNVIANRGETSAMGIISSVEKMENAIAIARQLPHSNTQQYNEWRWQWRWWRYG